MDPEVCRDGLGSLLGDESTALSQLEALLQREHEVLQAGDVAALNATAHQLQRDRTCKIARAGGS